MGAILILYCIMKGRGEKVLFLDPWDEDDDWDDDDDDWEDSDDDDDW